MSELSRRRAVDACITFSTMMIVGHYSEVWLMIPVFLFGMWNYWDGMTRLELSR